MKKLIVLLALLCSACGQSTTGPTPLLAARNLATAINCDPPSWNSVVFSSTELGKVTITNTSKCTNSFLFVVYDASKSTWLAEQPVVTYTSGNIAPNATAVLTLGLPDQCSKVYQRDVFFGVLKPSDADLNNFQPQWISASRDVFYATGTTWKMGVCNVPPPVIPPPTIPDPQCVGCTPTVFKVVSCSEGITGRSFDLFEGFALFNFTVRDGDAIDISIRADQKPLDAFFPQKVIGSVTQEYGPGFHSVRINLPPHPWQADVYCGLLPVEDLTIGNYEKYVALLVTAL